MTVTHCVHSIDALLISTADIMQLRNVALDLIPCFPSNLWGEFVMVIVFAGIQLFSHSASILTSQLLIIKFPVHFRSIYFPLLPNRQKKTHVSLLSTEQWAEVGEKTHLETRIM